MIETRGVVPTTDRDVSRQAADHTTTEPNLLTSNQGKSNRTEGTLGQSWSPRQMPTNPVLSQPQSHYEPRQTTSLAKFDKMSMVRGWVVLDSS